MPENTANWTPEDLGNGVVEARFWVNDTGPIVQGRVLYYEGKAMPSHSEPVEGYVGIVDNYVGGMVMYVEPSLSDDYCLLLNKAHEAFATEVPQ